jgi:hypothetical protein
METTQEQKEKVGSEMLPSDIERWASGQSNYETVYDSSDEKGHCRWCGGDMSPHYPKDGRALNYRCCSLFCQILYGTFIGAFELPIKSNGEINWAEGRRQLSALEDVSVRGNLAPKWYEGLAVVRYCGNLTDGRHSLPRGARKGQQFCGAACRVAAYRAKNAKKGEIGFIEPSLPVGFSLFLRNNHSKNQ